MGIDFKLTTTGDLAVENGDFVLISGAEEVAQRVRIRLLRFLGEWFEDTRIGVDWNDSILIKNPDVVLVEGLLKRTIIETEGVTEMLEFALTYDRSARTASVRTMIRVGNETAIVEV